jgi:VanZ family protein
MRVSRAATLAVLWALAVLVLTLMPASDVPGWPWAEVVHLDKIVHAVLFGVQCVLLGLALRGDRATGALAVLLPAVVLAIAYGGAIELLQQAMGAGRHGDWADLAADAAGALLGAAVLRWRLW